MTCLNFLKTMDAIEENGEVVCLYRIKEGHADCSYALNVAKIAGIDEKIIKRAEEVCVVCNVFIPFGKLCNIVVPFGTI